jgi:hypothetical protein
VCLDSVQLRVLTMFFGDNVHYGVTSTRFGDETRPFDHFSTALAKIVEARIWAGLHYAPPMSRQWDSARTWPATWRRPTSSRWATTEFFFPVGAQGE